MKPMIEVSTLVSISLLFLTAPIKCSEICKTQTCISVADEIAEYIDPTVDPCDDFNQFSCGGYIQKAKSSNSYGSPWEELAGQMEERIERLIKTKNARDTDFETDKKVRNFYNGCEVFRKKLEMGSDAEETKLILLVNDFKKTLNNIGLKGWPYSENEQGIDDFRWHDVVPKMIEEGLVFADGRIELPIINIDVGVNDFTKNESVLKINYPDSRIFNPESRKEDPQYFTGVHYSLPKAIFELLELLHPSIDFSAQMAINRSFEIHEALSELIDYDKLQYRLHKNYREYGLQEFNFNETTLSMLPPLSCGTTSKSCKPPSWEEYLNSLFHASGNAHITIDSKQKIFVTDLTYVDKVNKKFQDLQIQPYEMKNYMGWRVLVDYFVGANNFESAFGGNCVQYLMHGTNNNDYAKNGLLNLAVASMYVREYVDENKKKDVTKMVNDIRKTFKLLLPHLDWMDEYTKNNAIKKFEAMKEFVAYADELRQKSIMDEYYNGI